MSTVTPEVREEITEVLHRYARGVDRRDWELVRSTYHADALDRHGPFVGRRDALVDWLAGIHEGITFSMHLISNVQIVQESTDVAHVETYAVTRQITAPGASSVFADGDGEAVHTAGYCRYLDLFERREGVWAVADRTVVFDAMTRVHGVTELPLDHTWAWGARGPEDPSAALRLSDATPVRW